MERKASLSPSDELTAKWMIEKALELEKGLKEYMYRFAIFLRQHEIETKQATLDEHDIRKSYILDCLQFLLTAPKVTLIVEGDPHHQLYRCLTHVMNSLHRVTESFVTVTPGPM